MNRSIKILCVTLGLLIFSSIAAHATTPASNIITNCANKVNSAPSLTFKLTLDAGHTVTRPTLIVSKEKYRLSSPQMEVWYDGHTMWVYQPQTRELTISVPTADELLECNPLALLNGYQSGYIVRNTGSETNEVELVARSKTSTLRKASVVVDPTTSLPKRIVATLGTQNPIVITVDSAVTGKVLPANTFKYDSKAYPASEITDLR